MPLSVSTPKLQLTHETLQIPLIVEALGDFSRRFDIDLIEECDSTNSRLLARAETGAASGTVLVSHRQTAGRGRRGRTWLSQAGDSLTFSLLWRFPPQTKLDGLSLAVGVAIARALETFGIENIRLKWPNDILYEQSKLAGVLIELATGNQQMSAVIGIGLNLRLPADLPDELRQTATALCNTLRTDRAHAPISANQLLACLLQQLHTVLQQLTQHGFAALRDDWLQRHAFAGQNVQLLSDFAEPQIGKCAGVDHDGALLLETEQGLRRIISGEVSLRRIDPCCSA